MMKWMVLNLLLFAFPCWCQQLDPLVFREKTFDFGEIREDQGLAVHEFVFTNNSGRPVKILSVDASCGCTTSGWSKEPVPTGKTGFIKASFNPRGRPGYFSKSLSLLTDLDPNLIILQVKGEVAGNEVNPVNEFPVAMGNLHFKTRSFAFGKVFINRDPVRKEFPFKNEGTAAIKLLSVSKPAYLEVEVPSSMGPSETGIVRITFNGRMKNQYGFTSDNIQIMTDDPLMERVSMSVFASLEEYYAAPAGEEILTVPILLVKEQSLDLGHFKSNATLERPVTLKNLGKRDVQIKAVLGNCACISAIVDANVIRGGDSTVLRISFRPQNRGGTQQKAITIYSNDPRNPVQRIDVLAFIED